MGPHGPHPTQKTMFFFSEIIKSDPKLSKPFILTKYHMFWLSYECFSKLCNVFLLKSAISSHSSCADTDFDHNFNCFKCSAYVTNIHSEMSFCLCRQILFIYGSRWWCCYNKAKTSCVDIFHSSCLPVYRLFLTQITLPNDWEQGKNQVLTN